MLKTRLVSIGHQLVINWSVKKPRKFNIGQHSTHDRGGVVARLVNMHADQPMLTSRAYADQPMLTSRLISLYLSISLSLSLSLPLPLSPYGSLWFLLPLLSSYGFLWLLMAPYGSLWILMALMAPYGSLCLLMAPYGSSWLHMAPHGPLWPPYGPLMALMASLPTSLHTNPSIGHAGGPGT